jgi:hypothetical protein
MKNGSIVISIVLGSTLVASMPAEAGEFRVACSYKFDTLSRCADAIPDLVTDKYLAKFPAKKFSIFVHSDIHSYSNGGYVAYAVAGVVPTSSGQFPYKRFSATTMEKEKRADQIKLAEAEKENFRDAVKQLMDSCEISPTCDVYSPK